ncbi:hypothetical protein AJ80_06274 [Polytolypa hystricis UAMH7299]|uniref:Uncharacterized protein n=1 Tax=Polytolypa hystricis (strain UAMH7299) TaxID=1447883 RepID=A0A2B7XP27_POLH7|nr:hypothetical protein AJ80_06274 [Polytolypa hystricis UAMH7299]
MVDLTVGYVSGIIAAGVFVFQIFVPTATTLILAGLLSEENTLATWTHVGRALHSTHWPMLVNADSRSGSNVSRAVRLEGILRPLVLFLLALAAIITPLGLYDDIVPATSTVPEPFRYMQDTSPFGFGSPPRSDLGFNRHCGYSLPVACPSSDVVIVTTKDNASISVDMPYGYDIRIPKNVSEAFQSGLDDLPRTVSSFFNIEWRNYGIRSDNDTNNGTRYLTGNYRHLETLLLNDAFDIVEGLVVDTKNGGIGFRHHTTPSPLPYGSKWLEDLLFVEPHTQCVPTNLTIDFRIPMVGERNKDVVLTDRGGFSNLNQDYPSVDLDDTQANPDLLSRAYKAAYLNNAMTMMYMNVSNPRTEKLDPWSYLDSKIGKTFSLDGNIFPRYDRLGSQLRFGGYLDLPLSPRLNMTLNSTSGDDYPNPFGITRQNFTSIETICQGAGGLDYANITNIGVVCGVVYGAPRREDGSTSLVFEEGTRWSIPIYTCASAARAVIKTVEFRFNGTNGLKSLTALDIRDKIYGGDGDMPLWGVENTTAQLDDVQPIWGLVADRYKGRSDISVLQKESLWLPGRLGQIRSVAASWMNLPAMNFHLGAFSAAYGLDDIVSDVLDYSGATNMAVFSKWQDLSKNATTASRIMDMIWTDVAANAVMGNRGWVQDPEPKTLAKRDDAVNQQSQKGQPQDGQVVQVPVTAFSRRVKYRIHFAIPAFIVLALALVIATLVLLLCMCGRARPSTMKKYLFHTAPGRIMAAFAYPGQVHAEAHTSKWNKQVGAKRVTIAGHSPQAMDAVMMMGNRANGSQANMEDPLIFKEGSHTGGRMPPPSPGLSPPPAHQPYAPYYP